MNTKNCYLIDYIVYNKNFRILKEGKIKVKNKYSSIEAQVSLEKYLRKKIKGFDRLVVKNCVEDTLSNDFLDIFKDIFGSSFKIKV